MALVQMVVLAALLHASLAAYPGAFHRGAYNNGYYNNGAYNNGYYNNPAYAYNNGAYNPAYDGATFDPYPRYNFDYRVAEPRTGDFKNHQESRNGDAVRGQYSVAEPDGSLLTVRYAADDANGYTAVVERSGAGGTVVQSFPGPAPLGPGISATPGYVAPVAPVAPVVAPLAPGAVAPVVAPGHAHAPFAGPGAVYGPAGVAAAAAAAAHHGGRPFGAFGYPGYAGYGTSTTTFNGPHAAYSYTN